MSRVVKGREERKREILAVARQFFFQHGYEETTIQEIIDALGIAKGTFYHYFKSKMDLLDEMVEEASDEMVSSLRPILAGDMDAIEKFNLLFQRGIAFKMENVDVFLVFLRVLYKDENTIIRDKMYRSMVRKNTPLLAGIIKQGIEEELFTTRYPEGAAEMMMQMGRSLNESICRMMLRKDVDGEELLTIIRKKMQVYRFSIERILGAPEGSLKILVPGFEEIVKTFVRGAKEGEQ